MEEKRRDMERSRKQISWKLAALFLMLSVITGCGNRTSGNVPGSPIKETIESTEIHSGFRNEEECYLCGRNDKSLMDYYRRFDDLGIICTDDWYVLDMGIREHDEEGNIIAGTGGVQMGYAGMGENECTFETEHISGRGISKVTIRCGEESGFQIEKVKDLLCQDCLERLVTVINESDGKNQYGLCMVDFQTLELYPVQEGKRNYFIRDYYVEMEGQEGEIKILGVYAPERK